jgi:hypothetical protein
VSIRSAECSRTASDPSRATPTLGNCLTIVSSAAGSETHIRTVSRATTSFSGRSPVRSHVSPPTSPGPRICRVVLLPSAVVRESLTHPRMHHEPRRLPRASPDEGLAGPHGDRAGEGRHVRLLLSRQPREERDQRHAGLTCRHLNGAMTPVSRSAGRTRARQARPALISYARRCSVVRFCSNCSRPSDAPCMAGLRSGRTPAAWPRFGQGLQESCCAATGPSAGARALAVRQSAACWTSGVGRSGGGPPDTLGFRRSSPPAATLRP